GGVAGASAGRLPQRAVRVAASGSARSAVAAGAYAHPLRALALPARRVCRRRSRRRGRRPPADLRRGPLGPPPRLGGAAAGARTLRRFPAVRGPRARPDLWLRRLVQRRSRAEVGIRGGGGASGRW